MKARLFYYTRPVLTGEKRVRETVRSEKEQREQETITRASALLHVVIVVTKA